jgi:hypothetical protein
MPPHPLAAAAMPHRMENIDGKLIGMLAAGIISLGSPVGAALADSSNVRLPPLDNDPNRCERAFVGNTIGQANAVSDRALDLRFCKLHGKDLHAKTLSGEQ